MRKLRSHYVVARAFARAVAFSAVLIAVIVPKSALAPVAVAEEPVMPSVH